MSGIPVQDEFNPMGDYFLIRGKYIDVEGVRLDKVINQVKDDISKIKTDSYTKQQADDKFAAKTDVYTKSEVDTALNGKVSVQSGYGLISDAEKAQIQTNKENITAVETAISGKASQEEVNTIKSDVAGKASAEAVTQLQTDMSVQTARMDQLVGTVPAGSADEIADARVTADGKTEANLGNAIRSQVSSLKETIATLEQKGYPMVSISDAVNYWAEQNEKSIVNDYITPRMYGAVGDGTTDDTEAFKDCIANALASKMKIVVPLGIYKITDTLAIDGRVNIEGISREATVLDFSTMTEGKSAIQYCKNGRSSFCTLKHMTVKGNKNITAIYVSGSGAENRNLIDSVFEDLYIDNFKIGLNTIWCWCNSFRDIRINDCTNGMLLQSQTNNTLFDRVSIVNIAERCIDMVNCEGLQFNSCELANAKNGVRLWQAWATMYNPYFENISDTSILSGYTTGKSKIAIIGGKVEGKVYISQKDSIVDIRTAIVTSGYYPLKVVTQYRNETPCLITRNTHIDGTESNLLYSYEYGSEEMEFATEPYTLTQHENYASFYSSVGGLKFENLETGNQYTLAMNIRNTNNAAMNIKINSGTSVTLESNWKNNEFIECYMPFIAAGTALSIVIPRTIDVKTIKFYEGIYTGK